EFKIVADNAEHTVTVTDKAGNGTEYKITVYKKYMVTYTDGDGGSYEKNFNYGEVITIPTNEFFKDTFRKTGYTVKEWQGYTEGMTMPLKDLTFTAVYVPCEYTVSFDQNGGEVIEPITVTFGEKYGSLPSSAITGLSGGNKNWYLVDAEGNVTETNIKNLTLVSTARDHKLFIKRNVLTPSVSVALTVPGGLSDSYQYYIPGASQRILTANVGNMNTDILD
ncbi:MAG: InlB B-repeat-containing protein, partial [Lachnospiraceae bacterium]|nr:InlB B-repeat-containing protein [Lachnospiraceae bacterium]